MATESHRVVIGVEFRGANEVAQFTRAMQQASAAAASAATQVEFLSATRAIESTARMTREVQGLQSALQALQSTASQPLAITAGPGQPRSSDFGLPGPSRFLGRDRALELGQDQFLNSLRNRVRAEDVAAATALRAAQAQQRQITEMERAAARTQGFYQRLAQLEQGGAVLGIQGAQVVATSVQGPQFDAAVSSAARHVERAAANLDDATRAVGTGNVLTGKLNTFIEDLNRGLLQAMAATANVTARAEQGSGGLFGSGTADTALGIGVTGEIMELADRMQGRPTTAAERQLLRHGEATVSLLRELSPEARQHLVGDPALPTRGTFPVTGLATRERGEADFWAQQLGGLPGRYDAARAAAEAATLGATALPVGPQGRQAAEEAAAALERLAAAARSAEAVTRSGSRIPPGTTFHAIEGQAQAVQAVVPAVQQQTQAAQQNTQVTQQATNAARALAAAQQRQAAAAAAAAAATPAAGGAGAGGGRLPPVGGPPPQPPPPPLGGPPPPPGAPYGPQIPWYEVERQRRAQLTGQTRADSDLFSKRAAVAAAEVSLADVLLRGEQPFGQKATATLPAGYRDEEQRKRALAVADKALEDAERSLTAAEVRHAAAVNAANNAIFQRSVPVNLGTPLGPAVSPAMAQAGFAQAQGAAQAAGVLPAQTAVQAAQQNLATATAAHAAVQKATYQSTQAAGQAYLRSLGALTQAQDALKTAQQNAAQAAANAARWQHGFAGAAGGAGLYGAGTVGGFGRGGGIGGGGGFGSFGAGNTPGGGFLNDFALGFHGRGDRSYAEQLGQTMKFSLMYGTAYKLLFSIVATMQATLAETIEFQQGMTELAIATGRPKEALDSLADSVGAASVQAGFAPSQGIQIAARAQGLYGVTDADAATQDAVGRISAQVVSRMAVGAQKDPATLQADIAAIVQALGMEPTGQQRIADLDAYMTKKFGITTGSTLETVAQSASVGRAAGFTDEELFAIAANMQSRTGQTPSAVAGFMAQIFSRGGEGSLVDVARREGIDPNQELQGIIRQLADVYKTATPQEQAEISAAFGRGKIQNAAVALLGDYDEVLSKATAAAGGAAQGAADQTFTERMNNLGGEIAVLSGLFKQFASELGQSGVLDIVFAAVLALQQMLEAVNALLGQWNRLPNVVQDVILGMGLLLVAIRTETFQRALAARTAGIANLVPRGVPSAGGPVIIGPGGGVTPMATGPVAASGRAFSAAGAALSALINPATLAIGGLLAIGTLQESANRMEDALLGASQTLAAGASMTTAADFRNQAALLGTTATQNRDATGWLYNLVTLGQGDNENEAVALRLDAEAGRLQAVADRLAIEESMVARVPGALGSHLVPLMGGPGPNYRSATSSVFQDFGATDITEGLKVIADAGGSAATQFDSLSAAIFQTADQALDAAAAFEKLNAEEFAQEHAAGLVGTASQGINEFLGRVDSDTAKLVPGSFAEGLRNPSGKSGFLNAIPVAGPYITTLSGLLESDADVLEQQRTEINNKLGAFLTGEEVASRLEEGLVELDITSTRDLTPGKMKKLAELVGAGAAEAALEGSGATPEQIQEFQQFINQSMRKYLRDLLPERQRDLSKGRLTRDEGATFSGQLLTTGAAAIDLKSQTDYAGRSRRARTLLASVEQVVRRSPTSPQLRVNLNAAQELVAENEFAELENLRKTAQQNATSKRQIAAIGRRFINRAIESAVRNRSGDVLAQILGAAGKGSIAIAREAIDAAIEVANAAIDLATSLIREAGFAGPYVAGYIQKRIEFFKSLGMEVPQNLKDARGALLEGQGSQRDIKQLESMRGPYQYDPKNTMGKGLDSGSPLLEEDDAKEKKERETQAEINAARASAFATRSGSAIDAARAHIATARAALAKIKGKGVEYWNAMGDLFAGQQELAEALANKDTARAQALATRSGGAIDAAKANVFAARQTLSTINNKDAEYWEAMGTYWAAQIELADALQAYKKNQMLLAVDMTNPLAVARVDTRAAAIKLRADIARGAGQDVIAQDRVDLRSARANEEATRFSQRLQAVQTAEELGRISHSKYINYLENERSRLNKIKDRTFQQQDQLDQIDRLLQDASKQMEGQFNLGDIKLPTPYQVRRYVAEASGTSVANMARSNGGGTQVNNININGGDPARVRQEVERVVGKNSRTRTVSPRRR
jgi:Phage-related minor tail protein